MPRPSLRPLSALRAFFLAAGLLAGATAGAADYGAPEVLVPPSPFMGVHGLAFDARGRLLAGSVIGQSIYEVDRRTGSVQALIGPPLGMADDLAAGPDGTLAWTSFLVGTLHAKKGDEPVRAIATGLPGINSLAWSSKGRLFAAQVFLADALWEIDPTGEKPPRKIAEKLGGFNAFTVGPDGWLYGPLWFKGQVVRINPDSGEVKVVTEGLATPSAVKFGRDGNLYVLDTRRGLVLGVDPKSGEQWPVAHLASGLDNLAVADDGRLYVSNMADNSVTEVDPATGMVRDLTRGRLAAPGGIAMVKDGGKEMLVVADTFALRRVDPKHGHVGDLKRMHASVLAYPMNVAVGPQQVALSSWFTGTVQSFDRKTLLPRGTLSGFKAPTAAVELPDGSLLIAEFGAGRLVKASVGKSDGKSPPPQPTPLVGGLQGPTGLALAADGKRVYLTEFAGNLWSVDTASGEKKLVAEGLKQPEGVALTPSGRLVVAEVGARRIVEIDPANRKQRPVAGDLPIGLAAPPGLPPSYAFTGLAVGANGDVFFSSDLGNGLYRIPRNR